MSLLVHSPCKINLVLNILGRRPDGFHELETLMLPVPLFDELSFSEGASGIQVTCSDPSLAVDESNLVFKAARAFYTHAGLAPSIRIHLEKRIPMAAGLGGGSGDAASTLLALNQLHGGPVHTAQLQEL
ncbi:MAG: 4-(cytidine 5'-diphospho)-2-C-methyl-D-erythritol kinase, partial [Verrucomicrobia bacterium]|nr:4-(cytidine 5'-diphospho)-2-C-methyl-D-erythritol kinase [Verrucomicrobiota bacterium]